MNWKDEAKRELRSYTALKTSIKNLEERISMTRQQQTAIRSPSSETTPVQSSGNGYEDRLLDLIVLEERLMLTLEANRKRLSLIERGLAILNEQERLVALTFASNPSGRAVDILAGQINRESAQIYRIWNAALYRFTIAEYGIPEY